MTSVIMVMGGKGKRLIEANFAIPKSLIMIQGRPMFIWALQCLPLKMIDTVFLVCGKGQEWYVRSHVKNFLEGMLVRVVEEEEPSGIVNAANLVIKEIRPNSELIIAHSDQWIDFSGEHFLTFSQKECSTQGVASVLPLSVKYVKNWGYVTILENGQIGTIVPKSFCEEYPYALCGLYYFHQAQNFFDMVPKLRGEDKINGEWYIESVCQSMLHEGDKISPYWVPAVYGMNTDEEIKAVIEKGVLCSD